VEYGIHILVAASQEYVKTHSTRRVPGHFGRPFRPPAEFGLGARYW